jgi:nigerose phosphorylase
VINLKAEAGKTYTFHKYFAVFTDNDAVHKAGAGGGGRAVQKARSLGYEACLARHNAEWRKSGPERRHDRGRRRGAACPALQHSPAADGCAGQGQRKLDPARALSGQVYKGAIFWDTEMFMFPFFLHTYPEKAVELMRYRIKTLDGARRKAKTEGLGYRGAFYAWESQETGDDACTYFNIGDPSTGRELRTYFRDKQVHISGDVAIAMWDYFRLTGDDSLLLRAGPR